MRRKRNRAATFAGVATIILLLGAMLLISDNNRKYADALRQAVTTIWGTNDAITTQLAATNQASQANILTGLPMTQTRVLLPTSQPSSTPPYDPQLYATRQQILLQLVATSEPTSLAIFMLTETALAMP